MKTPTKSPSSSLLLLLALTTQRQASPPASSSSSWSVDALVVTPPPSTSATLRYHCAGGARARWAGRVVRPPIEISMVATGRGNDNGNGNGNDGGDCDHEVGGGVIPLLDDLLRRIFSPYDARHPRRRPAPPPDPPTSTSTSQTLTLPSASPASGISPSTDAVGARVRDLAHSVVEVAPRSAETNDEDDGGNCHGGRDDDHPPAAHASTTSFGGKVGVAADDCHGSGRFGGGGLDDRALDAARTSGEWGVGRRRNIIGARGDLSTSRTCGREEGAEVVSHDANAAAAAEAAWEVGSRSSSIRSSQREDPPAPFDRRGWDYDVGVIGDVTDGPALMEGFRWDGRNARVARTDRDSPSSSSDYDGNESMQRQERMRTMSARETYMAHKEYFDGLPGEEGSVDDISVAHDGNSGSGRVFITEKALVLARSLKLDVCDIFWSKKEHTFGTDEDRNGEDVEMAIVTEGDVREYLDRRCDRLISMISVEDSERRSDSRASNPSFNGAKSSNHGRNDDTDLGLCRTKEVYYHKWKESEDVDGSTKARFRPYPSKLQPQTEELPYQRRLQRQHENHQMIFSPPRLSSNGNGYNQGKYQSSQRGVDGGEGRIVRQDDFARRQEPPMGRRNVYGGTSKTHSIVSAPLSWLVSNPRSEPQHTLESRDISQFQKTTQKNFRNTYRVQQEQRQQHPEMQLKSATVQQQNRATKNDEYFRFAPDGYPQWTSMTSEQGNSDGLAP